MTGTTAHVAVMPLRRGGLRLLGITNARQGLWRTGGTYGNSPTALAEDPEHDSALLTTIRKELRQLGIELDTVTDRVIIAECKGVQRLRAWFAVWKLLANKGIRLHPFAMTVQV